MHVFVHGHTRMQAQTRVDHSAVANNLLRKRRLLCDTQEGMLEHFSICIIDELSLLLESAEYNVVYFKLFDY